MSSPDGRCGQKFSGRRSRFCGTPLPGWLQGDEGAPAAMTNERIIPLARDAEGRVTSVPDEAVGWRVFRHTGGRPRAELADDGQALRLPLGATQEDLAAVVSPGTYRLRPMTEAGELVGVGVDHDVAP